jgi:hypothetical protein
MSCSWVGCTALPASLDKLARKQSTPPSRVGLEVDRHTRGHPCGVLAGESVRHRRRRTAALSEARRGRSASGSAAQNPRRPSRSRDAASPCRCARAASPGASPDRARPARVLHHAQSAAPQHDDQRAQSSSVSMIAGLAHHWDDLLDGRRVSPIAPALLRGGRPLWYPGIVAGERRRPAESRSDKAVMGFSSRVRLRIRTRCSTNHGVARHIAWGMRKAMLHRGDRRALSRAQASSRSDRTLASAQSARRCSAGRILSLLHGSPPPLRVTR